MYVFDFKIYLFEQLAYYLQFVTSVDYNVTEIINLRFKRMIGNQVFVRHNLSSQWTFVRMGKPLSNSFSVILTEHWLMIKC